MSLPVALTCGEPAGVGIELALSAWQVLKDHLPFFLIADPDHVAGFANGKCPFVVIERPDQAAAAMPKGLPLLAHDFPVENTPGVPAPENAQSVVDVIDRAVQLVISGNASAVCTAPIHKKALQDGAGFAFPGHTEYLAHLAGGATAVMMLAAPDLRVVPVTIHIALADVINALSEKGLAETIRITHAALKSDFGILAPRIAVAGLNPHAGEGGSMGTQEQSLIEPVIKALAREGLGLTGPLSADTMFHRDMRQTYDAAVCMYHDQALIPIKTLDFYGGTNITLGLPFVRTSPDHGTALDIAGKGLANPASLIAAIKQASDIAAKRANIK